MQIIVPHDYAAAGRPALTRVHESGSRPRVRCIAFESRAHLVDGSGFKTVEPGEGACYPIAERRIVDERSTPVEDDGIEIPHNQNLHGRPQCKGPLSYCQALNVREIPLSLSVPGVRRSKSMRRVLSSHGCRRGHLQAEIVPNQLCYCPVGES